MGNIEAAEDKVDWTARPVQSLQDAQDAFVWVVRHYYYFDREERLARSEEIDKNIARWSRDNPKVFGKNLKDDNFLRRLMKTPCRVGANNAGKGVYCSNIFLMCFPSVPKAGVRSFPEIARPTQQVYETIDLEDMLELLVYLLKTYPDHEFRGDYLQWIHIVQTLGKGVFEKPLLQGAPSEMVDSILYSAFKTPMPNILPTERTITRLTRQQVEELICQYTQESIGELESRLRPGRDSEHGFLGFTQSLAQTIIDDAHTLVRLGVSRSAIADRLELIIAYEATVAFRHLQDTHSSKWEKIYSKYAQLRDKIGVDVEKVWAVASLGDTERQPDPFHPTFDNPTVCADTVYYVMDINSFKSTGSQVIDDCTLWPLDKCIRFTSLHVAFIRRICFFEGPGLYYRVDPELAAKVLRLI